MCSRVRIRNFDRPDWYTAFDHDPEEVRSQVRVSNMLGADGVFLGRLGNRYLRYDGPEHVMAFAPSRRQGVWVSCRGSRARSDRKSTALSPNPLNNFADECGSLRWYALEKSAAFSASQ